jgi:hypothetical protein
MKKFRPGYMDSKAVILEGFDGAGILAEGTTVPTDATAGYHPGCLFFKRAGTAGTQVYINEGTATSCDFNALGAVTSLSLSSLTATAAELNYLDQDLATNTLTPGAGIAGITSYAAGISRAGGLIITRLVVDLAGLIGSATDLHIIGDSGAASSHFGQITAAKSGTIFAGTVEVPTGGADDVDLYSATVGTGTQGVAMTDAALGTETALVTSAAAWTLALTKALTGFPTANDYLYFASGEAAGGTYTAGKFLVELYGE